MTAISHIDLIVIGAGPGGSTAAGLAAASGLKCLLLEKEELGDNGRYKACGGAMAWELVEKVHYPEKMIDRIIESLELHHMNGQVFSKLGKGAVVWRSKFDLFLTHMAKKMGAALHENEALQTIEQLENQDYLITTKNGQYSAPYVIAADGVTSPTLRALQWPAFKKSDLVLTITHEYKLAKAEIISILGNDKVHLFFGKDLIDTGYAWLFPKDEAVTLGWGNKLDRIGNTREEFNKFLALPLVKQITEKGNLTIYKPHMIPVGVRSCIFQNNVFAVGDAGGFVDPISGKGIPYAMMSGKIAVETILKSKAKGNPISEEQYGTALKKKFLDGLIAKKAMREEIFTSEEKLLKFLGLWEKYRSSKILTQNLL